MTLTVVVRPVVVAALRIGRKDRVQRVEEQALASPADVGEEAAFDRIVLRAVTGIVGHPDFHADGVGGGLPVLLEEVLSQQALITSVF